MDEVVFEMTIGAAGPSGTVAGTTGADDGDRLPVPSALIAETSVFEGAVGADGASVAATTAAVAPRELKTPSAATVRRSARRITAGQTTAAFVTANARNRNDPHFSQTTSDSFEIAMQSRPVPNGRLEAPQAGASDLRFRWWRGKWAAIVKSPFPPKRIYGNFIVMETHATSKTLKHGSKTLARFCAAVGVVLMVSGGAALPASAIPIMKIKSFTATPSAIGNTGGTVSLDAGVQGVTTCTFSVLPALVGLPTSMGCQNGTANKQVTIPANPGIARSFTFTITASNGNDHVSKTAVVKQAATLNFLSISAGFAHTCGVVTNHTVRCWGNNDFGQLGTGTTIPSTTPVAVSGLVGVKAVSTGGSESCALLTGGTVKCWGDNWYGGLGDGTRTQSTTPVAVSGLVGVKAVSTGNFFSCALLTGGTVTCWGNNNDGQLGNGQNNTFSTAPVAVSGLVGVTAIEASDASYTCARLAVGTVKCWGANDFGELGNQSLVNVLTPVAVSGLVGVTAITARGGYHTCARRTAGTVKCWGSNQIGQLGNGTTIDSTTPVAVSGLVGVTAITAGQRHTCALLTGGTVTCWGANWSGQLGDGTTTNSTTPVAVSGLLGVTAITAGAEYTCALVTGGKAYCWGNNFDGNLGDGTHQNRSTPVAVSPF